MSMPAVDKNSDAAQLGALQLLWVKAGLILTLLFMAMIGSAIVLIRNEARSVRQHYERQSAKVAVSFFARSVSQDILSILQTLHSLSASFQSAHDMENAMLVLQKNDQRLRNIFLLDASGTIKILLPFQPEMPGRNLAAEPFYRAVIQSGPEYIGFHHDIPFSPGQIMLICTPLELVVSKHEAAPERGILGVAIPLQHVFKPAIEPLHSPLPNIFVMHDGRLKYSTGQTSLSANNYKSFGDAFSSWPDNQGPFQSYLPGETGNQFLVSMVREKYSQSIIGTFISRNEIDRRPVEFFRKSMWYVALMVGLMYLGAIFLVWYYGSSTCKLIALTRQLERGSEGDLSQNVYPAELDVLKQQIVSLAGMIKTRDANLEQAYRFLKTHELMKKDVGIAQQIQQEMIPSSYPSNNHVHIAAVYEPAREVGGDLLDCYEIKPDLISLMIADVSGKGIPAALVMAQTKVIFRIVAAQSGSISDIMTTVNMFLHQNLRKNTFVTASYGHYDQISRTFTYCIAGQTPIYYYSRQHHKVLPIEEEESCCLGAWSNYTGQVRQLKLAPGDALLFWTDGAVEALNQNGEMFDEERLKTSFLNYCHLPAEKILATIIQTIHTFCAGTEPFDDLTLMIMKIPDKK